MNRILNRTAMIALGLAVVVATAEVAEAQRGGGGRGRGGGRGGLAAMGQPLSKLSLLNNEQVQEELNLSDEKKAEIATLVTAFTDARRELFQDFDGDFQERQAEQQRLEAEHSTTAVAALEPANAKRLQEIYVQMNGALALLDDDIAKAIALSEEQRTQLTAARDANTESMQESMQEVLELEGEERQERMTEIQNENNEKLLAVLNDEQKTQFEGLKGTAFALERSEVQAVGGRGGGRGGFGGGRGGGRGGARGGRGGRGGDAAGDDAAEGDAGGF